MMIQSFKHIVTAFAVIVGFSLQLQAATLDELYDELARADAPVAERIEAEIVAEWEKSGSPSLDLLLRLGEDALDNDDPELALEHFSALIDHDPSFAEGYNARATAYYQLNLIGPALDDLRTCLGLNPRHFNAMRGVGVILEDLGRSREALEVYKTVTGINPMSVGVQDAIDRLELEFEGQAI